MNKKIIFLACIIFVCTGSVKMYASYSNEQLKQIQASRELAVARYQAGALPTHYNRDDYGFSRVGVKEIDDERNKLENGGPVSLQRSNASADSEYQAAVAKWLTIGVQAASQVTITEQARLAFEAARRESMAPLNPRQMVVEAIRKVELIPIYTVPMPAPITVAQTEEAKFKIALEMIQKSKELQELGAALAAANTVKK